MGDTSYTGRKTWNAPRRHAPKRMRSTRLRRLVTNISRYGGFVAVAALVAGVILLQSGYLHPSLGIGKRATERFSAIAIDGDSLRTAGKEIRLAGIDAPELFQTCVHEDGGTWACGRQAHAFLRGLVSRGTLTCTSTSTDRYGRTLATCSAGDIADIGDAMVRAGYAVSFMSGIGYWPAELEARYHRRGIWSGTFDQPWDWRRRHPRSGS